MLNKNVSYDWTIDLKEQANIVIVQPKLNTLLEYAKYYGIDDTPDNKGMKWYVSGIGDDYGNPIDMTDAKLVKSMIKEYED